MRLRLAFGAALAAASFTLPANAQQWLADTAFAEGIGIRVGNLELHPGIGGEFGYDSNYFQRAEGEFGGVVDAFRVRVTPSLSLTTLGSARRGAAPGAPPMLNLRASAYAAYNEIFAAGSDDAGELSDQRHVTLGVNASADIAPKRPIGVDLHGDMQRIGEPSNLPEEDLAWDRWAFRGGAGVTWRPGGGLFEWRGGYDATFNYFEQDAYTGYNNLHHRFRLRGRWRFLPRTALSYDGSYTLIRYTEDPSPNDGEVVRSRIGISGLVTYRLALTGMIGWVSSFYDNVPENADTITASAEAKYFIMAPPSAEDQSATVGLSTVSLGYSRDMTNSYVNTFYTRDRVYASLNYLLGANFVTSLQAGYSYYTFPPGEFQAFSQSRIDAKLFAEYRFTPTVGLNATIRYDVNESDDLEPIAMGVSPEDLDFVRWQAYIGLRWFM